MEDNNKSKILQQNIINLFRGESYANAKKILESCLKRIEYESTID